jgi:hypothetical protein
MVWTTIVDGKSMGRGWLPAAGSEWLAVAAGTREEDAMSANQGSQR